MDDNDVKKLRAQRPLLLAMEAVGWLHMLGKARADFLRGHGGQNDSYDYKKWHEQESPPFPWEIIFVAGISLALSIMIAPPCFRFVRP